MKRFYPQFKPNSSQSKLFNPQQRTNSPQPHQQSNQSSPADNSSPPHNSKIEILLKTKVKDPHTQPRFSAIIARVIVISYLNVKLWQEEKRDKINNNSRPTGLTSLRAKKQSSIQDENPILTKTSVTDSSMRIYEPFLSECLASLTSDSAKFTPIKILRDTEASHLLIMAGYPALFREDFY